MFCSHPDQLLVVRLGCDTPELAEACRISLERRLAIKDSKHWDWEGARGQFINAYARLELGEQAYHHLLGMLGFWTA